LILLHKVRVICRIYITPSRSDAAIWWLEVILSSSVETPSHSQGTPGCSQETSSWLQASLSYSQASLSRLEEIPS